MNTGLVAKIPLFQQFGLLWELMKNEKLRNCDFRLHELALEQESRIYKSHLRMAKPLKSLGKQIWLKKNLKRVPSRSVNMH